MITEAMVDHWFTYHTPSDDMQPRFMAIRTAARVLALEIVKNTPESADQAAAIRKVREAVMTANAAIACKGR
jgi:hypothetical protein